MTGENNWVRRPRWWRRRGWIAAFVAFCLALTGAVVLVLRLTNGSCAIAGHRIGGQCIGLSDGSYHFTSNLGPVSDLIHADNVAAVRSDYVSVVYLMPLKPGPTVTYTADSARHEIEGAYTAQHEANAQAGPYGDYPRIKLMLGNSGTTDAQHAAILDAIRSRIGKDHIVAVAGLGTSTTATATMIKEITDYRADGGLQLGAVGTVLTADSFAGIKGLVRIAPTNSEEAKAAVTFLKEPRNARLKVLTVQDERSDDQYTRSLGTAFADYLPTSRSVGKLAYDSSQEAVGTAFTIDMTTLCADAPDVVYFAGRGVDLPKFLAPLHDRTCSAKPLIVLSGDDASEVPQTPTFSSIEDTLGSGHVRLLYTGLAHPGAWTGGNTSYYAPDAVGAFKQPKGSRAFSFPRAFPNESLDDGKAIMGFDAVLTTVLGARKVSGTHHYPVSGSGMIQIWQALTGTNAVPGASGYISFGPDGSPQDKALPIIEITATGAVDIVQATSSGRTPYVPK